jgi:hypothetical protein
MLILGLDDYCIVLVFNVAAKSTSGVASARVASIKSDLARENNSLIMSHSFMEKVFFINKIIIDFKLFKSAPL